MTAGPWCQPDRETRRPGDKAKPPKAFTTEITENAEDHFHRGARGCAPNTATLCAPCPLWWKPVTCLMPFPELGCRLSDIGLPDLQVAVANENAFSETGIELHRHFQIAAGAFDVQHSSGPEVGMADEGPRGESIVL